MHENRPHVLVVDGSPDSADSLAELVRLWGYDCEAHYDAAAALRSAGFRWPNLVLLEPHPPRKSGFEFVLRLRDMAPAEQVAVIVISGYLSAASRIRAQELGIEHYLLKPCDLVQLRELLDGLFVAAGTEETASWIR